METVSIAFDGDCINGWHTAKAIVDATPTTMVGRMVDVMLLSRLWHDDVDASDTATSLVTAEVPVDKTMLSTHGGRRQQHVNAGERCQEMARAGDSDGEGDGDCDGVRDGDGDDGDGNGLVAWMTGTAAATLPAMATTQESD
jgi:hypothetical protein